MSRIALLTAGLVLCCSGLAGGAVHPLDGHTLLVTSIRTGDTEIFIADPVTGDMLNVSRSPDSEERYPCWSPEGTRIAFISDRQHATNLYVMDANGEHVLRVISTPAVCYMPSWQVAPDGERIVFGMHGDKPEMASIRPDGSSLVNLGAGHDPTLSPDGQRICYTGEVPEGGVSVFTMKWDGSEKRRLVPGASKPGATFPNWSPDGKFIVYSWPVGEALELFVTPADGSASPRQVTRTGGICTPAAWSPDGQWISFRFTDEAYWRNPERMREVYSKKPADKRPVWIVRPDGSDAHVLEPLRFQMSIDGSRASWKPAPHVQAARRTFIDYFLPMPINGSLSTNVWGAATVGPRDPQNGLEDATMKKWCYWDGQILKSPDGKYHLFCSRWDQARGHNGWFGSKAVHAVSDKLAGPYIDKGLCWPNDEGGKGHNVTALVLPDGRYGVVISETRPGMVFVSSSPDGPWERLGLIQVATNEFSKLGRMSNTSIMVRPDGAFEIVPRSGAILISTNGVLGPYVVQGPGIYPTIEGLPKHDLQNLEDPVIWFSGGLYHIVVNNWSDRKAYHLTSKDGIHRWTYRGLAYDPTRDFARYTDGTVNHWEKLERPGVLLENGHVVAVTLAALDTPKETQKGNDNHGSKIIVLPFDGAALDRDLRESAESQN